MAGTDPRRMFRPDPEDRPGFATRPRNLASRPAAAMPVKPGPFASTEMRTMLAVASTVGVLLVAAVVVRLVV